MLGAKAEWKNAQKKLTKNITSDTINNSIPYLKPNWTAKVCLPSKVDSVITSKNQLYIKANNKPILAITEKKPPS
jgi:hypothetical protein